jgi:hypothetical protein
MEVFAGHDIGGRLRPSLRTSTSSWRKMVTPFSFPMSAVRDSHSTASKGDFLPSVKYLWKGRPRPVPAVVLAAGVSVAGELSLNACFTVAIVPPPFQGPLPCAGEPYHFTPLPSARGAALCSGLRWSKSNSIRRAGERHERKKDDCRAVAQEMQRKKPMHCRWPMVRTQPYSRCSAKHGRGAGTSRSIFFALNPGRFAESHGPCTIPDSVRAALPRPPNLDVQYQRMRNSCQEKNAKCG